MKITGLSLHAVRPDTTHTKSWLSQPLIANPMSIYPDYKEQRASWTAAWGPDLFLRIQTDDGLEGIGATVPAGARPIIEHHFRNLLIGQDPFNIEKLWDQMFRAPPSPTGARGLQSWRSRRSMSQFGISSARPPVSPSTNSSAARSNRPSPSTQPGTMSPISRNSASAASTRPCPTVPPTALMASAENIELIEWARDIVGPDSDLI